MSAPQSGIFALGTASHAYLEFDLRGGSGPVDLIAAIAALREPRTTIGGLNLVAGFRPELWREVAPSDIPPSAVGFDAPVVGADGFTMPATQHDALLWLAGSTYDVVFDTSRDAISTLGHLAVLADETSSWPYRHDRDLTGFIDGTENPSLLDAPEVALIRDGSPGDGGSVMLLQKWAHDAAAWDKLTTDQQQAVMGRTKLDSVELDHKPTDSHVASTDQDVFGKIFRRNTPYGTVTEHGTMFVGFSADQSRLAAMLNSIAGLTSGVPDALTRYARPLSGAYYFVPSVSGLLSFAGRQA